MDNLKKKRGKFSEVLKVTVKRDNVLPWIETLMANAMTLSATVGVTVIKCHEFSSGNRSIEQAAVEVPS